MRLMMQIAVLVLVFTVGASALTMPPSVSKEEASAALQATLGVLGTRYVWGGQTPSGFDCSGLAIWAYNKSVPGIKWRLGSSLVEDTTAHYLFVTNVKLVQPDEVWPGDLVFVTSRTDRVTHMGLFSRWLNESHTKFEWVEASSAKKGVVVSAWTLGRKNRDKWLVGVGRVLRWPSDERGTLSAGH